jgi:hypothetical protein
MTTSTNGLRASLHAMPIVERCAFMVELLGIIRAEVASIAREIGRPLPLVEGPPKRPKPARRGAIRRRQ